MVDNRGGVPDGDGGREHRAEDSLGIRVEDCRTAVTRQKRAADAK